MPIRPFLGRHTSFDAETVESMSKALAGVLGALGLKDKNDDRIVLVAKKIIELASAGEHDAERLKVATLKAFRH